MTQQKKWGVVSSLLMVWLLMSTAVQARGLPEFTELVEKNSAAVVNISTKVDREQQVPQGMPQMPPGGMEIPEGTPFDDLFKRFFGQPNQPQPRQQNANGSGFVLSDDGFILTNHHVIDGADEILVRFNDRTELVAELLGSDPRSDVALLKIDPAGLDLKAVKLGDSTDLKVGEWVLAIGSPFGFEASATAGIVSALGRSLPSDSYVPFIQTDVAINPGNSGGPLFNLDGEVVGINSQIYSRTGGFMGVSFAIPVDVVMNVVDQIKSQGYVSRGWLGVVIQDITRELAESFGLNKPRGALVSRVIADSPAAKAGFEAGDVILKFDGRTIDTSSDLPPIVGRTGVGKSTNVEIMRQNKKQTLRVVIEELPEEDMLASGNNTFNDGRTSDTRLAVEVKDLSAEERQKAQVENGGVLVLKIEPGPVMEAGIVPGDVIISLNNQQIKDAEHFAEIAAELADNKAIPVLVQRGGSAQFLALKIPE